jgi:hypothetical protein
MGSKTLISLPALFAAACAVGVVVAIAVQPPGMAAQTVSPPPPAERALKSITFNTQAYAVERGQIDKRSLEITALQDMHVVALEHFIGVGKGTWSDNGHILSTSPDNPWVKWEQAGTGMEPTGTQGYFGYCGRDYYSEVDGVDDIMAYESFPARTHVLVKRGETLYLHCYANNFSPQQTGYFHHMVRVLYW